MSTSRRSSAGVLALAGQIRAAVGRRIAESRRTFSVLLVLAAIVIAAQVARGGTLQTKVIALFAIGAAVATGIALSIADSVRWRNPRRALLREVLADDEPLAGSIDRAVTLAIRSETEAEAAPEADRAARRTAEELSALHLARQLAKVRLDRLGERAERTSTALAGVAVALAVVVIGVAAFDPIRIVEGVDVMIARGRVAPLPLLYLDEVDVVATPPPYMRLPTRSLANFDTTEQPRGTVLAVRGKPQKAGRSLVLTDGIKSVDFVDDGNGMVVARWTLGESANLRIAARFGMVDIVQRDELAVESIPDLAPVVTLTGAPKTVRLVSVPNVALEYEATDDHGLREIALVLRSGPNEDRRTLSKPAKTKTERGAHLLSTEEAFFRNSFVPVEITIEARDDDGVLGPKWGTSPAIIVLPPLVGEPEAMRYSALLRARNALVDLLAPRVTAKVETDAAAKALVKTEVEAQKAALKIVEDVLAGNYGGVTIRGRQRRTIAGQLKRLRDGFAAYEKAPTKKTYESLVTTTEDVVLRVDGTIRALGNNDARAVSKRLALVADECALAAGVVLSGGDAVDRGKNRLEAALTVLRGGGGELAKLGSLGADLGDIARAGANRIVRGRDADRFAEAKLAAEDLAARLRLPIASVSGGGTPGVESGGGEGGEVEEDAEGDGEAEMGGDELDELVKRHQQELDKLEQALEKATTPEEKEALKKLAKKHAESIREAIKDLPEQGMPGSAAEQAAEGKKRAASMAGSLEKGDLKDALKAGKEALEALRDAKKLGDKGKFVDDEEVASDATKAANRVDEAMEDLKKAMEAAQKNAKDRAQKDLESAGKNEGRLAERAGDLKKRGESGDAAMPDDMLDRLKSAQEAMKEAQKALEAGDAETGTAKQKEAQRLLEMARGDEPPQTNEDGTPRDGSDGSGPRFDQDTPVPDKNTHVSPEEFRKRVLEGMSKPSDGRLKNAVKRYTEGLIK